MKFLPINNLIEINRVVSSAILSWQLSKRVYRLSVEQLSYQLEDLEDHVFIGGYLGEQLLGVIIWAKYPSQLPDGTRVRYLHGLYVSQEHQGCLAGSRLLEYSVSETIRSCIYALSLKAWRRSEAFFLRNYFVPLIIGEHCDDQLYPKLLVRYLIENKK